MGDNSYDTGVSYLEGIGRGFFFSFFAYCLLPVRHDVYNPALKRSIQSVPKHQLKGDEEKRQQ